MTERIKNFVQMYFENIPYSEETQQAQKKIEIALNREFERMREEGKPDKLPGKRTSEADTEEAEKCLEELFSRYTRLSDMAVLAGYRAEDAGRWRQTGGVRDIKTLQKELAGQRRRIYAISLFSVMSFAELIWLIYDLAAGVPYVGFVLLYILLLGGIITLLVRRVWSIEKDCGSEKYTAGSFQYLRGLSDRYAKRRLNGIALFFAVMTVFILLELGFYFRGGSKLDELVENIFLNIIFIEVPLYCCIKNRMLMKMIQRRIHLSENENYKRHLAGITVFSAVYWTAAATVIIFCWGNMEYPVNFLIGAAIIFQAMIWVYDLVFRKSAVYKNIVINKRRIALITAAAVTFSGYLALRRDTWYTQRYINSVPVVKHSQNDIDYDEETGIYTITSLKEDFKILHLTDIHIGGSLYSYRKDLKALKACYAEIEHTKPDLVVVTGDLCFPIGIMSMSLNNLAPVHQFAAFMRNMGIPWAFTYGNHDTESLAAFSGQELNEVYKSLSYNTSGTLLYPYVQPDITGRNNQLIEVRNKDGSMNTALFLIDSNSYTGEGINVYDYIHDDQVDWYAAQVERLNAEEGRTVPSMAFFHIPLQQYRTAYELYEKGSEEVTYFFGENNERMIDKICCSDYPSKLFDRMCELGSTKAVFCGHDHYNNMSLEYKGIRLTYGMSIDYLAMPGIEDDTEQRGAELVTLHEDGTWELEQIPLDSIMDVYEQTEIWALKSF